MNQPTTRPGGDFNYDVMEAFRNAYAQQLNSPNDDSIANNSGMPTNTVANTSPWHSHTGLWRYPSGRGPEDDLKIAFNPDEYISEDEYEEEDEDLTDDDESPRMTDEEIESLIEELLNDSEEEEVKD